MYLFIFNWDIRPRTQLGLPTESKRVVYTARITHDPGDVISSTSKSQRHTVSPGSHHMDTYRVPTCIFPSSHKHTQTYVLGPATRIATRRHCFPYFQLSLEKHVRYIIRTWKGSMEACANMPHMHGENIQMFFFCYRLLGSLFWAPASTNRSPEKELEWKKKSRAVAALIHSRGKNDVIEWGYVCVW